MDVAGKSSRRGRERDEGMAWLEQKIRKKTKA
jgi:hypothetical protein